MNISYSEKVLNNNVFGLIQEHGSKQVACEQSPLGKSAFYEQARLLPIKALMENQHLSKNECFNALSAHSKLKTEFVNGIVASAIINVPYTDGYYTQLREEVVRVSQSMNQLNAKLENLFKCVIWQDKKMPVELLPNKVYSAEDSLLAIAVWSISIANKAKVNQLKEFTFDYPVELAFLKQVESKNQLIGTLQKQLAPKVSLEYCYGASELLVTTNTKYRADILDILSNGWV